MLPLQQLLFWHASNHTTAQPSSWQQAVCHRAGMQEKPTLLLNNC
jgi:hypothetical protein